MDKPEVRSNGKNKDEEKKDKAKEGSKKKEEEEELSDEDKELKEKMELLAERAVDKDAGVQKLALESLAHEIRTSTSSMTAVPKSLKFIRPHYESLCHHFETMTEGDLKRQYADVLSVIAMTWGKEGARECLHYKLKGQEGGDIGMWGHEYVRCLSGELSQEYSALSIQKEAREEGAAAAMEVDIDVQLKTLLGIVEQIVPYHMDHNAEHEACDVCMEVGQLDVLVKFVKSENYQRVCDYLVACASYVPEPEDSEILRVALELHETMGKRADALRLALRLGDQDIVERIFKGKGVDPSVRRQLAFMIATHGVVIDNEEDDDDDEDEMDAEDLVNGAAKADANNDKGKEEEEEEEDEKLADILRNSMLSEHFIALARDLEIYDAKTPEDVYKTHISAPTGARAPTTVQADSARQNLSSTLVNAFVNMGFGHDKLMLQEGSRWVYKNKDHGQMSASASVGAIMLWDVENGVSKIDKYLYAADYVKAGAVLGVGMMSASVRHECDPALAVLAEHLEAESETIKLAAVMGLGIAYAGTRRDDILELLLPIFADSDSPIEVAAHAALAAGFVYVGSGHPEITESIVQALFERGMSGDMENPVAGFLSLGLGLLYLGLQEQSDLTYETLGALSDSVKRYAQVTVQACAYAGSGSVLMYQKLLEICGEAEPADEPEDAKKAAKEQKDSKGQGSASTSAPGAAKESSSGSGSGSESSPTESKKPAPVHQAIAAMGLALVASAEEIGASMMMRTVDHLLLYGSPMVRRGLPMAIALLHISNPKLPILEALVKLSHDADEQVAHCGILGLGLVSAGSNNSRSAAMLRQLAEYYAREPGLLFMVRLAQGLLYMGKGALTLSPNHSDGLLLRPTALAGVLAVAHSMMNSKATILGSRHYLLYFLTMAARARILVTLNEDLETCPVSVRVGQAVDLVGQPGRPKAITGFQTQNTPVLLGMGERAELADEDCALALVFSRPASLSARPPSDDPMSSVLEGFVILKKKKKEDKMEVWLCAFAFLLCDSSSWAPRSDP